ncbi:MAG: O-antigen ligase family protein [Acidimicrobiales bacterium]
MGAERTTVAAAAWILLAVLAVDPQGWYPFGPGRWLVVSTGVCALLASTLWARRLTTIPRLQLVMLALVAVFALAATRGLDPRYAWLGTPERHFGVVTWLLLAVAFLVGVNLVRPVGLLWGIGAAGAVVGLSASAEAVGWEPRVFAVDDRLSAMYGSPAYLGAAVAVFLPVAVAVSFDGSLPRRLRQLAGFASPLLVIGVLGSGARAAWLGLAVATAVVGGRRRDALEGRYSKRTLIVAGCTAMAIAAAIIAFSPVGARVGSAFDSDAPGGRGRLDEWRIATNVAGDHLWFGVGPEGYRIAFAEGVDTAYERAHGRTPTPDRAHSAPIDVLLTGGIGALGLWFACVILVGRHVWRALGDERIWLVGAAAALVAHFVGQLVLFPLAEIEPIVWLLAGVVVVHTARPSELFDCTLPRIVAAVPAIAAVIALASGVTDVVADRRAREAVVASSRGDFQEAFDHASSAAALRPDELRLHLLKAEAARTAERGIVVALDAVDNALSISPRDPIVVARRITLLVDRAEATLVPDHADEARAAVAAAISRDPVNADLRVLEGRAARVTGDADAAERAWLIAEDLAPRSPIPPADLALLYLAEGRVDAAGAALARAVRIAPDDPTVQAVRARVEGTR